MNELDLLARLLPNLPRNNSVVVPAGDDCAVLDLGGPEFVLFKTDAVVEGIHFTNDTAPELVGRKALARCLSDIAAMGGTPKAALVTLALPPKFDVVEVERLYAGMSELARPHDVAIAGGETTTNPERLLLSIALLGTARRDRSPFRHKAQLGDGIFVTGTLGGSIQGKHLRFEPRLREGRWLVENFPIHSMIDLSDGMATDLRHILKASHVGAELLSTSIPISREAKLTARAESSAKPPLLAALTDGEDFELLFTLPPGHSVALLDGWKKAFPDLRLSCIGKITAEPGLRLRDKQGLKTITAHGYTHFEQP
jgi:thiamine-monophosphate kinase